MQHPMLLENSAAAGAVRYNPEQSILSRKEKAVQNKRTEREHS